LSTNELLFRLTSLEDPTLSCTTEGEEVTDAIGSLITTMYRAKNATFSASNSLFSLDLAARQFGSKKEIADAEHKMTDYTYEILTVSNKKITLSKTPSSNVKYIYSLADGEIGTKYTAGAAVSDTEFTINGSEITVPTGVTGKIYVEYEFENENAMRVKNTTGTQPEACSLIIYAYFRDKCNENIVYSGKIICPKAKLNPEQVEIALTATGKHAFECKFQKDYCSEEEELFSILISE
jgi:hypothetical protein